MFTSIYEEGEREPPAWVGACGDHELQVSVRGMSRAPSSVIFESFDSNDGAIAKLTTEARALQRAKIGHIVVVATVRKAPVLYC